jgi:hypothetical protein
VQAQQTAHSCKITKTVTCATFFWLEGACFIMVCKTKAKHTFDYSTTVSLQKAILANQAMSRRRNIDPPAGMGANAFYKSIPLRSSQQSFPFPVPRSLFHASASVQGGGGNCRAGKERTQLRAAVHAAALYVHCIDCL